MFKIGYLVLKTAVLKATIRQGRKRYHELLEQKAKLLILKTVHLQSFTYLTWKMILQKAQSVHFLRAIFLDRKYTKQATIKLYSDEFEPEISSSHNNSKLRPCVSKTALKTQLVQLKQSLHQQNVVLFYRYKLIANSQSCKENALYACFAHKLSQIFHSLRFDNWHLDSPHLKKSQWIELLSLEKYSIIIHFSINGCSKNCTDGFAKKTLKCAYALNNHLFQNQWFSKKLQRWFYKKLKNALVVLQYVCGLTKT